MIDVPVRVKDALRDGRRLKNYIFKVLNDDNSVDFVIDNDTLVKESVKIDERMCTGNQLKFGLCEGSSLEFQYFDHPNITGRQIQAFIEVQFVDENGDLDWYEIPMGFFTVDQCPMQFSTGIRKVTAYNKLKSAYLDEKANALIDEAFSDLSSGSTVKFYDIRRLLLSDYEISYAVDEEEMQIAVAQLETKPCGATTKLKAKYGIDTPLSWYMLPIDDHSVALMNLYPECQAYPIYADLDADKAYTFRLYNYLTAFEQEVYDTIKDVIGLSTTTNGQTFVDNMMNTYTATIEGQSVTYNGWCDFCGIILTREDGTLEKYSTIGFNNHLTNVVGTYDELAIKTIKGYTKILFNCPIRIYLSTSYASSLYEISYQFISSRNFNPYYWYGDSSLTWYNASSYKYKLPDGTPFSSVDQIMDMIHVFETNLTEADLIDVNPVSLADITMRDALSAVYELSACYGKLDRVTDIFAPIELNNSRLLPSDTLYPSDSLYPNGNSVRGNKSMYSKLWTDSQGVQTFRYLIITYKGLDANNQEVEKVLQRTVNADGTTDYNMSDNWLFKNLVWTDADVGDYADAMVLKMQSVSWFPFEMWCAGLPYLETGDELEITTSEGTYTSYVLQRQLNGIQNLQDTFIDGELDIF